MRLNEGKGKKINFLFVGQGRVRRIGPIVKAGDFNGSFHGKASLNMDGRGPGNDLDEREREREIGRERAVSSSLM